MANTNTQQTGEGNAPRRPWTLSDISEAFDRANKLADAVTRLTLERDELLAALKEVIESHGRDHYYDSRRKLAAANQALAAIARAEGSK